MAKTVAIDIDIHARDLRFLRAADTVLKKYELTRLVSPPHLYLSRHEALGWSLIGRWVLQTRHCRSPQVGRPALPTA